MPYKFNATAIRGPKHFNVTPLDLSMPARLASGKMVRDTRPIKNNYTLYYDIISSTDMQVLIDFFNAQVPFTFKYPFNKVEQERTVWFTEFPKQILLHNSLHEYWQNVMIVLVEQ